MTPLQQAVTALLEQIDTRQVDMPGTPLLVALDKDRIEYLRAMLRKEKEEKPCS